MQRSFGLQISDLETIQSVFEQELTLKETEKIVGGTKNKDKYKLYDKDKYNDLIGGIPIDPIPPCSVGA